MKEFKLTSIRKLRNITSWRHNEKHGVIANGHFFLFTDEPLDYFRGLLECDVHPIDDDKIEEVVTAAQGCLHAAVVTDRLNDHGGLFRTLETSNREVTIDERYYQVLVKDHHDILSRGANDPMAIVAWGDGEREVIGGLMPAKQMELDFEGEE